jgi:transposase
MARKDSRHACSGQIARGLFGGDVARAGPPVEERQPEPPATFVGRGSERDGPRRGGGDRGHDRQTLRDWIHRFNASGPEGLFDNWTEGPKPRLSEEHLAQFAKIVEAGPDREIDGVVRWRRIDLKRVIAERFGVDFHPRYVGKLLKKLGFSHISARPRHPMQDERIVEGFKKTSRAR